MANHRIYTKEQLEQVVKNSKSVKECLEKLNRATTGDMYNFLIRNIKHYNIDIGHFLSRKELHKLAREKHGGSFREKIPLSNILIENSTFIHGNSLKEKLYKSGLKERKCEECGQDEIWRGKKISLILDHINGIHTDNRIENLRILCPNCNATTDTFAGRNRKRKIKKLPESKVNWDKINLKIEMINQSEIDFTKAGWGVKLGDFLNLSPQRARKFIQKYMPDLWGKSFKHKN